jgi:hypothetical protein
MGVDYALLLREQEVHIYRPIWAAFSQPTQIFEGSLQRGSRSHLEIVFGAKLKSTDATLFGCPAGR